ncbi:MAG: MurR/RpiR family transcriptional regulator [Gemmatimonadota bacterium]
MRARDLILGHFESLGPRMQSAARYVIDHPDEVVVGSMRSVAGRANAQPATLVRLAQHLGLAGWPELKAMMARDLGLRPDRYGQRAKNLAARGRDAGLVAEMYGTLRRNLEQTERLSTGTLRSASRILRTAKATHIAGFRASFPVAYALFYGLRLFRDTVCMVDGNSGGLEMQMRAFQPHDAVVVTSFAPYSREALLVADAARATRSRLIAFTDSSASPLARDADAVVLFAVDSPSFFPSVTSGLAAAEALLEVLVAESGDAVVARIDRAEQQLFASGAYLHAQTSRRPLPAVAPRRRATRR